ncbi:MAG: tetratricopeptide repeat protein [Bacteroidales bacterium]|nr:tetratricopeptide repeat protein [Bacteroidales bacterium]
MKHTIIYSLIFVILFSSCSENEQKEKKIGKDEIAELHKLSIEEITQLIRQEPKNSVLYDVRSDLYLQKGLVDSAIHSLELAISIDSLESTYLLKLSELYLRNRGQSQKTKDLLEKCIRLFPKNVEAHINLANLNFYVRQYSEALALLDRVKEIDKYNPHQYYTRGLIYLETGDTAKALANFQTTVEMEASYYDAHIQLGLIFAYLGDSIALQYYRNAINLVPESIQAYYNMAMFYHDAGNVAKALETYNKLIEIDNEYYPAYHNIGYLYLYTRDFNKAIEYFTKAIEINHFYFQAFLHRGICYEELKDKEKAREDFNTCLELMPNYEPALAGLNRLDNI